MDISVRIHTDQTKPKFLNTESSIVLAFLSVVTRTAYKAGIVMIL